MTLDFVTLIAILFELHQWSILLRSLESVEVNSSTLLLCEDMVESSVHISATKWYIIYVNQKQGWSQNRSLRYT